MQDKQTSGVWLAAVLLLLLPLGVYVGGYFALCREDLQLNRVHWRRYDYAWQRTLFRPAATAESFVRGGEVRTVAPGDLMPMIYW